MVDKGVGKDKDGSCQFGVTGCIVIPLNKLRGYRKETRSDRGNLFCYVWGTHIRSSIDEFYRWLYKFFLLTKWHS